LEWSDEEIETPMNEEAIAASKEGNNFFFVFLIIIAIGVLYYMV
tara:strand:+ start:260 stop:391 length:132 start_codon:yes stop_codon:yes gene_type:complete